MRTIKLAVLAVLGIAVLAGCNEKYQLTFVNGTHEEREVILSVPYQGTDSIGTLHGLGDKIYTTVKISDDDDLPATLTWHAGDLSGKIDLDKKTQKELTIPVDTANVGPVDKHTDVKIHEKKEGTEKVHEGTVVE